MTLSRVATAGVYAYVAAVSDDYVSGVLVVRLSDPSVPPTFVPLPVGTVADLAPLYGEETTIVLVDSFLPGYTLEVWDLRVPTLPNKIGSVELGFTPYYPTVETADGLGVVSNYLGSVHVFDLTDPRVPRPLAERLPTCAMKSAVSGELILFASSCLGLDVLSLVPCAAGPPSAAFSIDPMRPVAGRPARFLDESSGAPAERWWSFGDGTMSDERNPLHRFELPGAYTVRLRVTNVVGQDETSQVLTVDPEWRRPAGRLRP